VKLPLEKEQLTLVCEECEGKKFSPETLQILYKGMSIHDVLEMTVEEAEIFFRAFSHLVSKLTSLLVLGLGYLKMGQPAPTLSGGEAQRIKLACDLKDNRGEKTLYLLDEPCTGLHFDDIAKLALVLFSLVEQGHTVVVIEQQQDFIKLADWVIEMGPGRGDEGGRVVSQTRAGVARI